MLHFTNIGPLPRSQAHGRGGRSGGTTDNRQLTTDNLNN